MERSWRQEANEEAVASFFARWDPAWRWILILGLRELRRDPGALGRLASVEANGNKSWAEDNYAYGPLSAGITAAAVNEAAQHCEDLFALIRYLRETSDFAKRMANYAAGKITAYGARFAGADIDLVSRAFLVPDTATVTAGLQEAPDPKAAAAAVEAGRARLADMVRRVAAFYVAHEDFHVQYKHGLKLPLRPFGDPTREVIEERKIGVRQSLFTYTTDPIAAMVRRQEQSMMFVLGEVQQAHLSELVQERNVLRLRLLHEVDLNEIVDLSHTVMRLLQVAQTNRLALGKREDENQTFTVPGQARWEQVDVAIRLDKRLGLDTFREPSRKKR